MNFARCGSHPLCRLADGNIAADQGNDLARQVAHAHLVARAEVDLPAHATAERGDAHKSVNRVGHKGKVPGGRQVAHNNFILAESLGKHGRNDGAVGLSRAEGVERPADGHGQSERMVEAQGQSVSGDLAGGVRRLWLAEMALRDLRCLRRSVYLTGGSVNDSLHLVLTRRNQGVERAQRVHLDDLANVLVRVRNTHQRGEVEDHADAAGGASNRLEIANVAFDHLQAIAFHIGEKSEIIARVVANESAHQCALGKQSFREMTSDEASRASHQHVPAGPFQVSGARGSHAALLFMPWVARIKTVIYPWAFVFG